MAACPGSPRVAAAPGHAGLGCCWHRCPQSSSQCSQSARPSAPSSSPSPRGTGSPCPHVPVTPRAAVPVSQCPQSPCPAVPSATVPSRCPSPGPRGPAARLPQRRCRGRCQRRGHAGHGAGAEQEEEIRRLPVHGCVAESPTLSPPNPMAVSLPPMSPHLSPCPCRSQLPRLQGHHEERLQGPDAYPEEGETLRVWGHFWDPYTSMGC